MFEVQRYRIKDVRSSEERYKGAQTTLLASHFSQLYPNACFTKIHSKRSSIIGTKREVSQKAPIGM